MGFYTQQAVTLATESFNTYLLGAFSQRDRPDIEQLDSLSSTDQNECWRQL